MDESVTTSIGRSIKHDPQRNAQFENISRLKATYQALGNPVISMDTKKKEPLGLLYRAGQCYTQADRHAYDHDFWSLADGARTASLGQLTWPLVQHYVDDMQTVPDAALIETVRFMFYRMKLVVEPSGALAAAALLNGTVKPRGRVGVLVSGGNIDAAMMIRVLSAGI